MERNRSLSRDLMAAFIYPILICTFALFAILFLTKGILINFMFPLEELGVPMTSAVNFVLLSEALIKRFMPENLIAIFLLLYFMLRKEFFFNLILFPGFGAVIRGREYAAFTGILSILLKARLPLQETLRLAADTTSNLMFRGAMQRMASAPEAALSELLRKEKIFQPSFVWLVAMAEKNEILDEALLKMSGLYAAEAAVSGRRALGWLEPSLLVAVGVVVACIVVGSIIPYARIISAMTNFMIP
jgi:type II secretory pathway component PulF